MNLFQILEHTICGSWTPYPIWPWVSICSDFNAIGKPRVHHGFENINLILQIYCVNILQVINTWYASTDMNVSVLNVLPPNNRHVIAD